MRKISMIIVHCSDSITGDAATIDQWHKARGWSGIGYHYVVLRDGTVERGRPDEQVGAHCEGSNKYSLGVCMIGKGGNYSVEQVVGLIGLLRKLLTLYKLPPTMVLGHRDFTSAKTCPDFDAAVLQEVLQ